MELTHMALQIPVRSIPPVANSDSITTHENRPVSITLTGSVPDGDVLTYSVVRGPSHGSLSGAGPNLIYTPNANFNGSDSFTFKVSDETADSDDATVSITVNAVNDPPMANDDSTTTQEDTPVTIDVLSNDIDVDGDTLTVTTVTQGRNGSVTINPDNTLSYNPNADFYGTDAFTYTVSDGTSDITATVKVTVNPAQSVPQKP